MDSEQGSRTAFRISRKENVPASLLADFLAEAEAAGVPICVHTEPNQPRMSALGWAVFGVAAIVTKAFADAFLKRAADDVANAYYPGLKASFVAFCSNLLSRKTNSIVLVGPSGPRPPESYLLAVPVMAATKYGFLTEFLILENLTPQQLEIAVTRMFGLIADHHSTPDDDDELTRLLSTFDPQMPPPPILLFDAATNSWLPMTREQIRGKWF